MNHSYQLEILNGLTQKLSRTQEELARNSEMLNVHKAYMNIIERLNPKYGVDKCEDGLTYDVRQMRVHLEKESLNEKIKEEFAKKAEMEKRCQEDKSQPEREPSPEEIPNDSEIYTKKPKMKGHPY